MSELKEYPIEGSVWFRESTREWVLELTGTIEDTNFTSRHTQPEHVLPQDVPGLPNLYPDYDGGRTYPSHWPEDAIAEIQRLQAALAPLAANAPAPEADTPDDHLCSVPAAYLRAAERALVALPDVEVDAAPKPFG